MTSDAEVLVALGAQGSAERNSRDSGATVGDLDRPWDQIDLYRHLMFLADSEDIRHIPCSNGCLVNGCEVRPLVRRIFRELPLSLRQRFSDPFDGDSDNSFYRWLRTAPGSGEFSPFLNALYAARPDVASAFASTETGRRQHFLRWPREVGAPEMGFHPDLAVLAPRTLL